MSLLSRIVGNKQPRQRDLLPIVQELKVEFRSLRKQWFFGNLSLLKKEWKEVEEITPMLEDGSEIDNALKGFQLCSIIGFSSKQGYYPLEQIAEFEKRLVTTICEPNIYKSVVYQDRYLNCQGDIPCLEELVALDMCKFMGKVLPDPDRFFRTMKQNVSTLAVLSQAATATAFGDADTAKELRSLIKQG